MSAETVAYALLVGSPGVTHLTGTRVYPDFIPVDKTLPAVALTRTPEVEYVYTIHDNTVQAARVELEAYCMASSRAEAEALADAVLALLTSDQFAASGRRPSFDPEQPELFVTVLTFTYWE